MFNHVIHRVVFKEEWDLGSVSNPLYIYCTWSIARTVQWTKLLSGEIASVADAGYTRCKVLQENKAKLENPLSCRLPTRWTNSLKLNVS